MAIVRWEPARELHSLQHEVNRLFGLLDGTGVSAVRRWVPAMDLTEGENEYVLRADLPGVAEADVHIEVEDGVLSVSGERKSEREERKDGYHRIERASGRFSRSLTLPEGVDPGSVAAKFENGVLEVKIPKPAQRKPHRVEIGVGSAAPVVEGEERKAA